MVSYDEMSKLLTNRLKRYSTSTEFVNDMYKYGLSRHSCMVLELLLLGRGYDRIMRVLLFTEDTFYECLNEIHTFLKNFKSKRSLFHSRTSRK